MIVLEKEQAEARPLKLPIIIIFHEKPAFISINPRLNNKQPRYRLQYEFEITPSGIG
jgi:hypothetical protein